MNWRNTSWEPPKEPYDWCCLVCETNNPAGRTSCSLCKCPDRVSGRELQERQRQFKLGRPYDGAHRAAPKSRDPLKRLDGSNKLPIEDLLRYPFFTLAAGYAAYTAFLDGKSTVYLSRHSKGVLIEQYWALSFVISGYLLLAVFFMSQLIDHFDRRPNESIYKTIAKWSVGIGFPSLLIGIILQSAKG